MKKYIKSSVNPDMYVLTPKQAYLEWDLSDYWDSPESWCQEEFEMSADDIKKLYGVYDGSNEDTGIATKDGRYYIAYSGHGLEEVSKVEMMNHFKD